MKDSIQVLAAGSGGITVMLSELDLFLKCCIGAATLGFIIYKWIKETKK